MIPRTVYHTPSSPKILTLSYIVNDMLLRSLMLVLKLRKIFPCGSTRHHKAWGPSPWGQVHNSSLWTQITSREWSRGFCSSKNSLTAKWVWRKFSHQCLPQSFSSPPLLGFDKEFCINNEFRLSKKKEGYFQVVSVLGPEQTLMPKRKNTNGVICVCMWSRRVIHGFGLLLFNHSVVSSSLQPHGLQHARLTCPLPTPGACPTHVHWVGDAI